MHRHGRSAARLRGVGTFDGVDMLRVKARADLHRDGMRARAGADDLLQQTRLLHERASVAVRHHLRHGTARIDVEDCKMKSGRLRHPHGLRKHLRLMAEELHGEGLLLRKSVEQGFGLLVPIDKGPGGDHLRGGQRRALLPAEAAEGEIRHPRHGRQGHAAPKFNVADSYHRLLKTENSKFKTEDPVPRGSGRCPSPRGG